MGVVVGILWIAGMLFAIYLYIPKNETQSPEETAKRNELLKNMMANARSEEHENPKRKSKTELTEIELLRNIERHTENSAFVLKRFLVCAQIFAVFWLVGMIAEFVLMFWDKN